MAVYMKRVSKSFLGCVYRVSMMNSWQGGERILSRMEGIPMVREPCRSVWKDLNESEGNSFIGKIIPVKPIPEMPPALHE